MAATTIGEPGGVHWLSRGRRGLVGWAIGTVIGEGFARRRLRPVALPAAWDGN